MSYLMYLASDFPLEEVGNAHYNDRLLSINEALAAGMRLPDYLDGAGIDRDAPGTILWQEKDPFEEWKREERGEGCFDRDFSILDLPDDIWEVQTEKEYRAQISWGRYSEGRARNIIAYIQRHLEKAEEIEIWSLWLGGCDGRPFIRRRRIPLDALVPGDLERLDAAASSGDDGTQHCLVVSKT